MKAARRHDHVARYIGSQRRFGLVPRRLFTRRFGWLGVGRRRGFWLTSFRVGPDFGSGPRHAAQATVPDIDQGLNDGRQRRGVRAVFYVDGGPFDLGDDFGGTLLEHRNIRDGFASNQQASVPA